MMKNSTRRMWARRVLRAGWLLAPVLQFPSVAWNFLKNNVFKSVGDFFASMFVLFICWCICWIIYSAYDMRTATPEKITELVNAAGPYKACAVDLIPRRIANWNSPLSVGRVKDAIADCETVNKQAVEIQRQKAALR